MPDRRALLESAVTLALWHETAAGEVAPARQLARWRGADGRRIAAELAMIAHASTAHRHRPAGAPAVWLRIAPDGLVLDVLGDLGVVIAQAREAELLQVIDGLVAGAPDDAGVDPAPPAEAMAGQLALF